MLPDDFLHRIIRPSLRIVEDVTGIPGSHTAALNLLAIAGQESGWTWRHQKISSGKPGPARGFWQFERNGGVAGVLKHRSTRDHAARLCEYLSIRPVKDDVWRSLEGSDVLATGFARLLLWSDPKPLPVDTGEAWSYYLRNWRPGKPHPSKWAKLWAASLNATISV